MTWAPNRSSEWIGSRLGRFRRGSAITAATTACGAARIAPIIAVRITNSISARRNRSVAAILATAIATGRGICAARHETILVPVAILILSLAGAAAVGSQYARDTPRGDRVDDIAALSLADPPAAAVDGSRGAV